MSPLVAVLFLSLAAPRLPGCEAAAVDFLTNPTDVNGKVNNCKDGDPILTCERVEVNFQALSDGDDLRFPDGTVLKKETEGDAGDEFQAVEYKNDNGSEAILTFNEGAVSPVLFGSFQSQSGEAYVIENCGDGCTVWIHEDESKFGESGSSPDGKGSPTEDVWKSPELSRMLEESRQSGTTVTVDLYIYYTSRLRQDVGNIDGYIGQQVAEANQIMANSRIPLRFRALCRAELNIALGLDSDNLLARFNAARGSASNLYASADLAILLTERGIPVGNNRFICGQVTVINVLRGGFATAFSARLCSTYTFTHELGHLFGAQHDRNQLDCPNCRGYNYGLYDTVARRVSVMGYRGPQQFQRVAYFSTPTLSLNGRLLGASDTDNRRQVMETRVSVSQLRSGNACSATTACRDIQSESNCVGWRNQQYCTQTYVAYMRANCARTCAVCQCTENNSGCGGWANAGYCTHSYVAYMLANCQRSCRLCG